MTNYITALIFNLLILEPNHPLNQNVELREVVASDMVHAGKRYGIPPDLLTVWFFEESSLRINAVGKKKEFGISQIHPCNFELCRSLGYSLDDSKGQMMCGAAIMDIGIRKCGTLTRGLWFYASNRGCPGTDRAKRITARRLRRVERLAKKLDKDRYLSEESHNERTDTETAEATP